MEMKNVDDNELREFENASKNQPPKQGDITDDQLIAMTRSTFEGEGLKDVKENIRTELAEPPEQVIPQIQDNNSNSPNYWPIDGLPSNGRLYPQGTQIIGRPLKVLEVKKVASINDDNGDFIINDVLKRTVRLNGMKLEDVLIADKVYIIMWLRANTYRESGYVVNYMCSKCEKKSEFHFELNDLEIQHLSDKYDPNKEYTLPTGTKIKYKYLTIGDDLYIDRFVEMNSDTMMEVDSEILAIARMVTSINGDDSKTMIQKYHWITNMNTGDFAYMTSFFEKYGMGVKPYINAECKKCGGTSPVGISFRADFFIPDYKFE